MGHISSKRTSNAASREVRAKNIKVRYYVHPEYGNIRLGIFWDSGWV